MAASHWFLWVCPDPCNLVSEISLSDPFKVPTMSLSCSRCSSSQLTQSKSQSPHYDFQSLSKTGIPWLLSACLQSLFSLPTKTNWPSCCFWNWPRTLLPLSHTFCPLCTECPSPDISVPGFLISSSLFKSHLYWGLAPLCSLESLYPHNTLFPFPSLDFSP